MFHYLRSHNVGSCEGGHFPARDGAAYDDPDQAEDPEGHADNLNSSRSHSVKRQDGTITGMRGIITAVTLLLYFAFSSAHC